MDHTSNSPAFQLLCYVKYIEAYHDKEKISISISISLPSASGSQYARPEAVFHPPRQARPS